MSTPGNAASPFLAYGTVAANMDLDTWLPSGVSGSIPDYITNGRVFNVKDAYGAPGATGDGMTDDTTAILNACLQASAVHGRVYFPFGQYAMTTIALVGLLADKGTLMLFGDGSALSSIVRLSGDVGTVSDLFSFDYINLEIQGLSFDHGWDGSAGSTKSCVDVYKADRVRVRDCDFTQGQYHGIKITACDDVIVDGNTFSRCYYDGIGLGGGLKFTDGTDLPYGSTRVAITGNTFDTLYGSIVCQVYVYELAIANNVISGGSIQIGQATNRLSILGNTIYQSNTTYGYGIGHATEQGIFVEAAWDIVICGNVVRESSGDGIKVTGSELVTVPAGPQEGQIPLKRVLISDNQVYRSGGTGILIAGQSFDGSLKGDTLAVVDNIVRESGAEGITLTTSNGALIANNTSVFNAQHGLLLAATNYSLVTGNRLHDNSSVTPNSYHGLSIDQGSLYTRVFGNDIGNTTSTNQRFGVLDGVLNGGTASLTQYRGNVFHGNVAGRIFPVPASPALGAWQVGDYIENTEPASGMPIAWVCVTAGTPGTWVPVSIVPKVSTDRGDVNVTLISGVDAPTQQFGTNLTANRTVSLSTTGAVSGSRFRIFRRDTGGFTLNVGGLKTLPVTTPSYCDVEYDGSTWRLTAYGLL